MRQVVLDLMREAADAGATILLSSHNLSEVAAVCGRAGILREGRLVELAPISEIVQLGEHRLKVWFTDGVIAPEIPAERLPGVRLIEQQPGMLHLAYQGSSDAVLKWLAHFPVERINTPQTSLEEAFMQYYKPQPETAAKGDSDSIPKGGNS
jgi:ABC-2 type transport system ATP-binding protein